MTFLYVLYVLHVVTGANLTDQENSTLNPANAARQLGFTEESEAGHNERENQMRGREQSTRQEYRYAMLNPLTVMVMIPITSFNRKNKLLSQKHRRPVNIEILVFFSILIGS